MPGDCFSTKGEQTGECISCKGLTYGPVPDVCPHCGERDVVGRIEPLYAEVDASKLPEFAERFEAFRAGDSRSTSFEIPRHGWTIRITCACGKEYTEALPATGCGMVCGCRECGVKISMHPVEEPLRK